MSLAEPTSSSPRYCSAWIHGVVPSDHFPVQFLYEACPAGGSPCFGWGRVAARGSRLLRVSTGWGGWRGARGRGVTGGVGAGEVGDGLGGGCAVGGRAGG